MLNEVSRQLFAGLLSFFLSAGCADSQFTYLVALIEHLRTQHAATLGGDAKATYMVPVLRVAVDSDYFAKQTDFMSVTYKTGALRVASHVAAAQLLNAGCEVSLRKFLRGMILTPPAGSGAPASGQQDSGSAPGAACAATASSACEGGAGSCDSKDGWFDEVEAEAVEE